MNKPLRPIVGAGRVKVSGFGTIRKGSIGSFSGPVQIHEDTWIERGPTALARTGSRQAYMLTAELMRDGHPIPHDGKTPALVVRHFWDNEAKARRELERDKRAIEARYVQ